MKASLTGLLLVMALMSGSAAADEARVLTPEWARKPSGEDVALHFPAVASVLNISGVAVVGCKVVAATGELKDCQALHASPAGFSFDGAGLRLSRLFRMKPFPASGGEAEGTVRIPIRFQQIETPAPARPVVNAGALAEARRYLEARRMAPKVLAGFAAYADSTERGLAQPGRPDPMVKATAEAIRRAARDNVADYVEEMAYAYASVFSEPELADLRRQLSTPAGRFMQGDDELARLYNPAARTNAAAPAAARSLFCAKHACDATPATGQSDDRRLSPPGSTGAGSAPRSAGRLKWDQTPPLRALTESGPALARELGVTVTVRLTCEVAPAGDLAQCRVIDETPSGFGAAAAALGVARLYRLKTDDPAQPKAGETIDLPINFFAFAAPSRETPASVAPPSRALDLARQTVASLVPATWSTDEASMKAIAGGEVAKPDPQVLADGLAALREGYRQARREQIEVAAVQLAALFSEADLESTAAFGSTIGGKAYIERSVAMSNAWQAAVLRTKIALDESARRHLCAQVSCAIEPYVAEMAAPSTAKP